MAGMVNAAKHISSPANTVSAWMRIRWRLVMVSANAQTVSRASVRDVSQLVTSPLDAGLILR